jgi:hypothetical protein
MKPVRVARDRFAPAIRTWWDRRGSSVLLVAVACMASAALWRLGNELPQLLWSPDGAFDLRLRHGEVHRWFAGLSVYDEVQRGDYPPASYVILWPLVGWLPLAPARWLWAVTTLLALAWLGYLCLRESGASTRTQAVLVLLLPFSIYPATATMRVGQLINHTLPLLLAGLLLLQQGRGRWRDDLLASGLLLPTLVKPTLVAPFFWLVCFLPRRLRPIVLVSVGYILITLLATSFQEGDFLTIVQGWMVEKPQVLQGHANAHKSLALLGLRPLMLPFSVLVLVALAWWVFRNRDRDFWIVLGVAAVVAHFYIHHRLYDDLLILLPMITLFRLAKQGPAHGADVTAGILFALTWVTVHAPASVLAFPPPLSTSMELGQTVIWLAVLVFLLGQARREPAGMGSPIVAPARRMLDSNIAPKLATRGAKPYP